MKWHKVEDYPVGSDEYVLVSKLLHEKRSKRFYFMARLDHDGWWSNMFVPPYRVQSTDRWCHIDLPED